MEWKKKSGDAGEGHKIIRDADFGIWNEEQITINASFTGDQRLMTIHSNHP